MSIFTKQGIRLFFAPAARLQLATRSKRGGRRVCTNNEDSTANVPVCILDPRTAFEAAPATAASVVRLVVPRTFLPLIASPTFELGEADDPMSSWIFGQRAEIFQYSFAGNVRTQSGWVGAITADSWEDMRASKEVSWDALQSRAAQAEGGLKGCTPGQPFLFVGQILEAAGAAVYVKREGGKLQGLMIATSDDEISTP